MSSSSEWSDDGVCRMVKRLMPHLNMQFLMNRIETTLMEKREESEMILLSQEPDGLHHPDHHDQPDQVDQLDHLDHLHLMYEDLGIHPSKYQRPTWFASTFYNHQCHHNCHLVLIIILIIRNINTSIVGSCLHCQIKMHLLI